MQEIDRGEFTPLPAYSTWVVPDVVSTSTDRDVPTTRPLTPYNLFLDNLKDPSCREVVAAVKRFSMELPIRPRSETAKLVHEFLNTQFLELIKTSAFSHSWLHHDVSEGLEKFTLQKIYSLVFQMDRSDSLQDLHIRKRLCLLGWITLQHLDIPATLNFGALDAAINHLRKIDKFKAPLDKITIIINTCKILSQALQDTRPNDTSKPAADQLLPLIIYTLIQANPPRLASNIAFIQHFRHPKKLVAQEAYALTQICAAIEYTKILNHSQLQSVTQQDFDRLCKEQEFNVPDDEYLASESLNTSKDSNDLYFNHTTTWRSNFKNPLTALFKKSLMGLFTSNTSLTQLDIAEKQQAGNTQFYAQINNSYSSLMESLMLIRDVLGRVETDDFSSTDAAELCLEKLLHQHAALRQMQSECMSLTNSLIDSLGNL